MSSIESTQKILNENHAGDLNNIHIYKSPFEFNDFMDDYEALKQILNARKKTMSSYVREKLTNNTIIEQSNGESALMFFEKEIQGSTKVGPFFVLKSIVRQFFFIEVLIISICDIIY